MTQNVGKFDRVFRLMLGIVLLAAPFVGGLVLFSSTAATTVAIIAGVIMLATAATSFCPIYSLLGIKTCKA